MAKKDDRFYVKDIDWDALEENGVVFERPAWMMETAEAIVVNEDEFGYYPDFDYDLDSDPDYEEPPEETSRIIEDVDFDQVLLFIKKAHEVCEKPNKIYEFTCPICGTVAKCSMSGKQKHHQMHCQGCELQIIE